MFKLINEPRFTHEIEATVPVDGGFEKQKFKVTYRVVDPAIGDSFEIGTTEGSTGFLKSVVCGLADIENEAGELVPYSEALLDQLLKLQFVRVAMARGYFEAMNPAKQGN